PILPIQAKVARSAALTAIGELRGQLLGPMDWLGERMGDIQDLRTLRALVQYHVPARLGPNEEVTLGELSRRCGLTEDAMGRLVHDAVNAWFLAWPKPGYVAHSAVSMLIRRDGKLGERIIDMHEAAWPLTRPTAHHNQAQVDTQAHNPTLESCFASNMNMMQTLDPASALIRYDWGVLGRTPVVVQLRGSTGALALELADRNPGLKMIVQDLKPIIEKANNTLPLRCAANLQLQEHGLFTDQPHHYADAYFFSMVLNTYDDKAFLEILRHLGPALKPGARLVINDLIVHHDVPVNHEGQVRRKDMPLISGFKVKERHLDEWRRLVEIAD
ncbi:S-adenosyl-L-methionine-dependent methyltransferase, partial [Podospora didyma]